MPNRNELLERIENLFGDTGLGDGVSLREALVIDDYGSDEERAAARAEDEREDWHRLIGSTRLTAQSLCFMDDAGVRFHLPAYLVTVLKAERPGDFPSALDGLLFQFSRLQERDLHIFSVDEITLFHEILGFLRRSTDDSHREEVDECLSHLADRLKRHS